MKKIINEYLTGNNSMSDPVTWFNEISKSDVDHYSNQNW